MGACFCRLIGARIENEHLVIVFGLAILLGGCNKETPVAPPIRVVETGPIEPAEVELSNPKVRIDDGGNFRFEVNYLFTSGKPRQHYLVTVNFPGTSNLCLKHMEAWELKQEGVIRIHFCFCFIRRNFRHSWLVVCGWRTTRNALKNVAMLPHDRQLAVARAGRRESDRSSAR